MSSSTSNPTVTLANQNARALDQIESNLKVNEEDSNHTAQALVLVQIESILKLKAFGEDIEYASILSSSTEEDYLAKYDVNDSLTLKHYDNLRLVRDEVSDGNHLDRDISQQDDKGFVSSHSSTATVSKRSGVRRGQRDSAEAEVSTSVTLNAMETKHDGASREQGNSDFNFIQIGSSGGSSLNIALANPAA